MSIMIWENNLSVGVNELDNQHKAIINIINRLYDCVGAHDQLQKVKELLPELYWYASEHFRHEEMFMLETSYERIKEHKQIHRDMLEEISSYLDNIDSDNNNPDKMADFFKKWLIQHIVIEDKAYAKHAEVLPQQ